MKKPAALAAVIALPLTLLACAGNASLDTASVAQASGGYGLSATELEYDCKQLTGRMQIRLLAIRDYSATNNTTAASRALQSGSTATFGGTSVGTDPSGAYARDVAMLEAYNRQLAAKNCNTFDLASELQPKDFRETPTASIRPASGPSR